MLPTPSTSHLSFDIIYEPSEDSYLLLDTLSLQCEITFLHNLFHRSSPSPLVAEIGTGSGVVLSFLTTHAMHIFGRSDILTLGTDISKYAASGAVETIRRNTPNFKAGTEEGMLLSCIITDLASALRPHQVDVLVFNPPYVPTPDIPSIPTAGDSNRSRFDEESQMLSLTYAGGPDGMATTDRLLHGLDGIISERGVLYLLLCAQNKPEEIAEKLRNGFYGSNEATRLSGKCWNVEKVGSSGKKAAWEVLSIWRIWR